MVKTFGQRVKELRQEKAWTQERLTAKTGISVMTIARIENGAGWNSNTVIQLAKAFDVSLSVLFEGVGSENTISYPRSRGG